MIKYECCTCICVDNEEAVQWFHERCKNIATCLSWYNYSLTCRTIKWQRRYLALKDFRKFVVEWHSVFCKSRTLTGQLWNLPTVMWKIWKRLIAKFLNWQGLLYVSFVTTSLITCLNRNNTLPEPVQSSGKNGK